MNELILLIIVVALLVTIPYLVSRIKKPQVFYLKIGSTFLLLVLIWGFNEKYNLSLLVAATIVITGIAFKHFLDFKKYRKGTR
jgi:hypothetical protein